MKTYSDIRVTISYLGKKRETHIVSEKMAIKISNFIAENNMSIISDQSNNKTIIKDFEDDEVALITDQSDSLTATTEEDGDLEINIEEAKPSGFNPD